MIIQILQEVINDIFSRLFILRPTRLVLFITHRCNARCIMCSIWKDRKKEELSFEDYKSFFSTNNKFFNRIKSIVFTGGEPCVREDLTEIVKILIENIPKIRKIVLTTNGIDSSLIILQAKKIAEVLKTRNIQFIVQVSLDSLDESNDKIRGIKDAASKILVTIDQLKDMQRIYPFIKLSFVCVIQPLNVTKLDSMLNYSLKENLDFFFNVVTYSESFYENLNNNSIRFNDTQREIVIGFLQKLSSNIQKLPLNSRNIGKQFLCYELAEMLKGKKQKRGCPMLRENLALESDGKVIPCARTESLFYGSIKNKSLSKIWWNSKNRDTIFQIKKEFCPTCMFACGVSILSVISWFCLKRPFIKNQEEKNL